ncbi:MAG: hypothetical protein AB8G17_11910 [Gammaproteobacteria bacterium]
MALIEDAGNFHSVESLTLAQAQVQPDSPAQAPSVEDTAEQILDVGSKRFARDDYDARAEAFAETIAQSDKAFREDLLVEILEEDPNALGSWLEPGRINDLVESGDISHTERAALAETFAGVYNNGGFAEFEIGTGLYTSETITITQLDTGILSISQSPMSPGQMLEENARIVEFVEFIDSGRGPETAEFRETYSEHLIETYVLNDAVSSGQRQAAAALSAELLTGDSTRPGIAVDVLSDLDPSQLSTFMDNLQVGTGRFNAETLALRLDFEGNGRYEVSDLALGDGVAAVYNAVASAQYSSAESGDLAVELARTAEDYVVDTGWQSDQTRINAFGRLVNTHSESILDALTNYDRTNVSDVGNGDQDQYEVNANDLADVLALTAFNPDSPYRNVIQDKVIDYANNQAEIINNANGPNSTGFEDAVGRLAVLSAASGQVVNNEFDAIAADRAAQQQLIGFVVDLALAAVPLGDLAGTGVKNAIADVLPEGFLRDAVQGLSGEIINSATGQLTNEAKEQLYATLDDDVAAAVIVRELQNTLEPAFIAGITDERDATAVITRADSLADDLAD